jgi:hypothetical protein
MNAITRFRHGRAGSVRPSEGIPWVTAVPNPVPIPTGAMTGSTVIQWSTGTGQNGIVTVQRDEEAESPFASGAQRAIPAAWIAPGSIYLFRLYRKEPSGAHGPFLASIAVVPSSDIRGLALDAAIVGIALAGAAALVALPIAIARRLMRRR